MAEVLNCAWVDLDFGLGLDIGLGFEIDVGLDVALGLDFGLDLDLGLSPGPGSGLRWGSDSDAGLNLGSSGARPEEMSYAPRPIDYENDFFCQG